MLTVTTTTASAVRSVFVCPTDVQKFISKFGTAAHLAILAVAPLFLYPFCSGDTIATVTIWLSLPAAVWTLTEPSRRSSEMLHDARERVVHEVIRDPLLWILLSVLAFAGLRWANSGIALVYDAEQTVWRIGQQPVPFFPGCTKGAGYGPFATVLASTVLLTGCRHALGKSARIAFLFSCSALAGVAAVTAVVAGHFGHAGAQAAMACSTKTAAYAGSAYGLYFLAGVVSLVGAFECGWNKQMLLFSMAIGGSATGLYFFAPVPVIVLYLVAGAVVLLLCCGYAGVKLGGSVAFKCVAGMILASFVPVLCVMGFASQELNEARFSVFGADGRLFDETFFPLRDLLSRIAAKVWGEHPWIGTGLGSFPLDIRFNAVEADWGVLPPGQAGVMQGWWQLLAERGITGALTFVLVLGALGFAFVRRLCGGFRRRFFLPACALGPVALIVVAVETFIDSSFMRADVMLCVGALFALAGASFPQAKRKASDEGPGQAE